MEQEVASSVPRAPDRPDSGTAVVHAMQQHTPAQASRTPSRAAPMALSATRELLRHPPSSTASPGAMKQWRDDVDRLLGMTHSTSSRSRPQSSWRQREATTSVRSPSVRGAQTDDLRAELNRRRTGEDTRVSLERARERRQNIEGRNLDRDFAAEAPQTPVGAQSQTGVPLADMGCVALVDHLRVASWPPKFRPHLSGKYDETSNPSEFLQVYVTAITAGGGNTTVMATYFQVALSGPARTWLMNLTPGSVCSWEELCARFVANFASAYQQHGVEAHLHAVRQEPGETLRKFISRFTKVQGTIPRISDASIITAFRQRVRDEKMLEKLATHDVETVPHSSLWPTNAPEPPRAVHGTQPHKLELPSRVVRGPSSGMERRKRRRTTTTRSHGPLLWWSRQRPVARATATNARDRRRVTAVHALCTRMVATAPQSVARSSTSQNASASGANSPPKTAPRLAAGPARKRWTTVRWSRLNETSGISRPRGT
jgi:hypothetical protein